LTALGLVCCALSISACAAGPTEAGGDEGEPLAEGRSALAVAGGEAGGALLPQTGVHRAGDLDTTFGGAGTGIARLRFGADDEGAFFALDTVGNEIIAGGWGVGGLGGSRFRVARLRATGVPDIAFGRNGMVTTSWAASTADYVYAVAVGHQSDGGTIAMGWRDRFKTESANIALARYEADGTVGSSFGDNGKSLLDLGGDEEIAGGLVLPDDSIVVVGKRDDTFLVARATARGALDTSFAAPAGYWTESVGTASEARAVALDDAGRLLVAGWATRNGQSDMVLARLTRSGVLDTSFGNGGVVIAGDPASDERAVAVAPAPGGAIVVAGHVGPEKGRSLQVRRFLADGSADCCFGRQGVVTTAFHRHDDQAESVVVFPDGGILVGANDGADPNHNVPELVRLACDGSLETAFGNGGLLPLNLGEFGVLHVVRKVAPDQVLVGGGDVGMSPGPGTFGVVARLWM
jgi:uncharacterized delta-60 repeat protein